MGAEACLRLNAVFVDDPQASKLHMVDVLIPGRELDCRQVKWWYLYLHCEGEGVERLEPAMVSMTSLVAPARYDLDIRGATHCRKPIEYARGIKAGASCREE